MENAELEARKALKKLWAAERVGLDRKGKVVTLLVGEDRARYEMMGAEGREAMNLDLWVPRILLDEKEGPARQIVELAATKERWLLTEEGWESR